MSKMYEILAIEGDLKKKAAELTKATIALFGQPGKFTGQIISAHTVLEGEPDFFPEKTEMASTVGKELKAVKDAFGDYVDVTVQKEVTNTTAFADVTLGDTTFLTGLSATALLNLESRLSELEDVYKAIPTLDTTERWKFDKDAGCYVSDVRSSHRMKKVPKVLTLAPATVEHPAQAQVYSEDIPAYLVEKVMYSGMITPSHKQECLDRIAKLAAATKQARQRANDTEIKPVKVADKIFAYINDGKV